jgi:hypothetical protein
MSPTALTYLAVIVCSALIGFYVLSIRVSAEHPLHSDFSKFYASTVLFWQGEGIYTPVPIETFGPLPDGYEATREYLHPNLNPPFQTLLLAPMGLLDYSTAFWIWSCLSLACGIVAIFVISSLSARQHRAAIVPVVAVMLLFYFPTYVNVLFGQMALLVLLLIAGMCAAVRAEKGWLAGLLLGLGISIKPFLGLFVVSFLLLRKWRVLGWSIGTALTSAFLAGWAVGFHAYIEYYDTLKQISWYAASWNASLLGFFSRLFGGSENSPLVDLPAIGYVMTYAFSAWILSWIVRLARMRSPHPKTHLNIVLCLSAVAMLLISPLGWMYYFPVLLISVPAIWGATSTGGTFKKYRTFALLAFVLSTVPRWLIPSAEMNEPVSWFVWSGTYFYALVIMAVLLFSLGRRLAEGDVTSQIPQLDPAGLTYRPLNLSSTAMAAEPARGEV